MTLLYLIKLIFQFFIEPSNGTNTIVDQCRGEKLSVGSNYLVH